MPEWDVVRRWREQAETGTDAIEKATPGSHRMVRAIELPPAPNNPNDYSQWTEHPLHDVPVEILTAARNVTDGAIGWADIDPVFADSIADAIVIALRPWLWWERPAAEPPPRGEQRRELIPPAEIVVEPGDTGPA